MSKRGALMVEMVLRNQSKNSGNNNVKPGSSSIQSGNGSSNNLITTDDSDEEPLSRLLNNMNKATENKCIPSENSTLEHLSANCLSAQTHTNKIDEEKLLFEVPNNNNTFSLPLDLLTEMRNQKVILSIANSEEESGDSLRLPEILNAAGNQPGILFLNNNTILEEVTVVESEVNNIQEGGQYFSTNVNRKRPYNSKREETATKRLQGDKYTGYTRSKDGKVEHNKERAKRTMKTRCLHKTPHKQTSRTLLCGEISEEIRKTLFEYFWKLPSWSARKSYLQALISTTDIKRRRKDINRVEIRKKQSRDCFLPKDTGTKVLVCRTMLLNTFDIGRNTFERWTTNIQHNQESDIDKENAENEIVVASKCTAKNVSKSAKQQARQWINDLPKVPSHYCRASSKKLYLESIFRSTLHIYKVYTDFCGNSNKNPISRSLFRKILQSENIAIHKPRKDQCDLCCSWKSGNISEGEYNNHIKKKNQAEVAKREAKESLSDEKFVVTMDLQSVLLAPKLDASAVYYKQKLQIHNFTVYALNNKQVDLYVWHETNGGVTSNEFTTCIVNYIEKTHREKKYKHIVLISDGCGYQNRNKVLSSTLLRLSENLNIIIEQLILERGHTMMECDAVHSSLEAYFKPPMYAPSDYITRMRQARDHHPYHVYNLDFTFFRNYGNIEGNLTTIKPGRDAKVTDIRGLLYLPTGTLKYKLNHSDGWVEFEKPRKTRNVSQSKQNSTIPQQLYGCPIKISKQKYDHLQELKKVIERDYHPFYDSLPHH